MPTAHCLLPSGFAVCCAERLCLSVTRYNIILEAMPPPYLYALVGTRDPLLRVQFYNRLPPELRLITSPAKQFEIWKYKRRVTGSLVNASYEP